MVNFFNSERVGMVMLYGVAKRNARLARDLWFECFSNRAVLCVRTFTQWPQTHDRGRDRTERILQAFRTRRRRAPTSAFADL